MKIISLPKISQPAGTGSYQNGQNDYMLQLIAFGPAEEYMKKAGITAEEKDAKSDNGQKDS